MYLIQKNIRQTNSTKKNNVNSANKVQVFDAQFFNLHITNDMLDYYDVSNMTHELLSNK